MVLADSFSLTVDAAQRLFGYELESIREYDALVQMRSLTLESGWAWPSGVELMLWWNYLTILYLTKP